MANWIVQFNTFYPNSFDLGQFSVKFQTTRCWAKIPRQQRRLDLAVVLAAEPTWTHGGDKKPTAA
jgi:hypothetical protein